MCKIETHHEGSNNNFGVNYDIVINYEGKQYIKIGTNWIFKPDSAFSYNIIKDTGTIIILEKQRQKYFRKVKLQRIL